MCLNRTLKVAKINIDQNSVSCYHTAMSVKRKKQKTLKNLELFAGVGGFHIGLDRASKAGLGFETVLANQWEPATGKNQHAAWVYKNFIKRERLDTELSNEDIWSIVEDQKRMDSLPEFDILTGGFPCQDYSVARPLSLSAGLEGKKGVLWWSIYKLLEHAQVRLPKKVPPYVFLENVDRLLKSPSAQRGRDFSIMLSTLSKLGYVVEWRVVNAADYGFPQRRRRTFILGYHKSSTLGKEMLGEKKTLSHERFSSWAHKKGVFAKAFPVDPVKSGSFTIADDPHEITNNFMLEDVVGDIDPSNPYMESGVMIDLRIYTMKFKAIFAGKAVTLGDVINNTNELSVPASYYIHPDKLPAWQAQKSSHAFERTSKSGVTYMYKEGALPFPDPLTRASRTIITSEGGSGASRMKHIVDITGKKGLKKGRVIDGVTYKYRRLIPDELEELCMFPRGHTEVMLMPDGTEKSAPDTKRAFFMGNALVVGVIEKIGKELLKRLS